MADLLNLLLKGLSLGSIYALSATGFVLIFRTGGIVNMAHGQIMAMGAFIFLMISTLSGIGSIPAFVITVVTGLVMILFIERLFIRPLSPSYRKQGIFATLGIMLMLKGVISSFSPVRKESIPGAHPIDSTHLFILAAGTALVVIFLIFLRRSSFGLYVRAVSDNRKAALSIGIPIERLYSLTGIIAGMAAFVSGILMIIGSGLDVSDLGPMEARIFPAIILGGLGSMRGAILGGILMGILETYAGGQFSGPLKDLLPYLLLLAIMLLKPKGLFPNRVDLTWIKE